MTFSKQFPKNVEGSNYTRWIEVYLDEAEERDIENKAREENVQLMKECIKDAKRMIKEEFLNEEQSDIVKFAIALFEKRASHTVHFKETKAKEKFDQSYKK